RQLARPSLAGRSALRASPAANEKFRPRGRSELRLETQVELPPQHVVEAHLSDSRAIRRLRISGSFPTRNDRRHVEHVVDATAQLQDVIHIPGPREVPDVV